MIWFSKNGLGFFFLINFYLSTVALHCCTVFYHSKVNQLYVYMCPLIFGFPSDSGHYHELSRVLCAVRRVLISDLFHTEYQYVNPNLPFIPPPLLPLGVCTFVLYVCLCFCFANKTMYTIFLCSSCIGRRTLYCLSTREAP